ncbi:MAG: hypothetical protein GC159_15015 [Phycisphaera sp.]|nr:hypothetical protein [Phycisphaera sp.]
MAVGVLTPATRAAEAYPDKTTVLILVGAPGASEYAKVFNDSAQAWSKAADAGDALSIRIGNASLETDPTDKPAPDAKAEPTDRDRVIDTLKQLPHRSTHPLWVVMLGHGTYDGRAAKFNLTGPDITADDLVEWLRPFERPVVVINAASSSAPYLKPLSAPGRVIITATKAGSEQNYARFGEYISHAIGDPDADLDKDGQTSLLEAFLVASRRVAEFYDADKRLATEHALLDDNGDGLGTRSEFYRGVRPVKKAASDAEPDGYRAHLLALVPSDFERHMPADLRAQRDALELQVVKLRDAQDSMAEDEYLRRVEPLLIDLARVYRQAERAAAKDSQPKPDTSK